MGFAKAKCVLSPSDKITVYFATTRVRADNIENWGFREGIRIRVTEDASQPGIYEEAESYFEIILPESIIARYEQQPSFINRVVDSMSEPEELPREWKIPTEILNTYPKIRKDYK